MNTDIAAPCTLGLANIGVVIRCDDEQILAALRHRYAAFPCTNAARFTLHVSVQDAAPRGEIDLVMAKWRVHAAASSDHSWIDVEQGQGEVVVGRTHALELTEYWLRVVYALLALEAGGLLVHAAGIVRNGRAFLFCGRSGSGKTTAARVSPNDVVLNDDLVLVLPRNGYWIAHATPFSNPTQVPPTGDASAPVAALLHLVQDRVVALRPLSGGTALAEAIANVPVLSADPAFSRLLFERCQQLVRTVPVWYLHFLPDASFWPVVEAVAAPA